MSDLYKTSTGVQPFYKIIFCIVFIGLLNSCALKHPVPAEDSVNRTQFVTEPFGIALTPEHLEAEFGRRLKTEKRPVENIHVPGQIDTVLIYHYRQSSFHFYQSPQKTIFYEAQIHNPRVRLMENIRTGLTRKDFYAAFRDIELNDDDDLTLSDEFETQTVRFRFENDKLKEIIVEQYID